MGKGLQIKRDGIHIAFTAGTGNLLFLDLVAHLIRKNLKVLNERDDSFIGDNDFKFILFISFPKQEDAIGYQLCKGLETICQNKKIDNFEFHTRFSQEKTTEIQNKWDYKFIDENLERYSKKTKINKVWVCGPPIMNE